MSDHQDRAKQLPDRGGRLQHHPRSDLEHAAREVIKNCERLSYAHIDASMGLALDNLRKVLGDELAW